MANTPNYGSSQFLDAATFNAMSGSVYNSLQQVGQNTLTPGLILPENVSITINGMIATLTFPAGFGIVFSNGTAAQAIGNTSGATSQTYTVNFAPLIPGSGSITAYLQCQASTVGQSPITIVGPPPGHPDWNPNFIPYTLYSITADSITVTASSTPPNLTTNFALGAFTLTAGMSTLPAVNQSLNYRAGALSTKPVVLNSGIKTLTSASQGLIQNLTNSSTFTLPLASPLNGCEFELSSSTANTVTVQSQGSDVIWGTTGSTSVTTFALINGSSAKFVAQNGAWYIMAASPSLSTGTTTTGGGGGPVTTVTNTVINVSTPPATDIDMDLNDTVIINFSNVQNVPTFIATNGGVFRIIICIQGTTLANNDLIWLPNNVTHAGDSTIGASNNTTVWATENSNNASPSFPYLNPTTSSFVATADGFGNPLGWFAADAFGDGARPSGDNINDLGPCLYDVVLCTSTTAKMMKYNGGVAGGCGLGFIRWFDTTTPWSILGTFGFAPSLSTSQYSTISGFCTITKVGGSI